MCSFPGSRLLQWALLLPLVLPTYIIGYAYADLLAFAGPVQGALAPGHRLEPRRLLVPRSRLGRRRRPPLHAGALSLRLSRRAHRLPQPVAAADRGEPHPGPRPVAHLLRRRPAAGAARHRRRRGAGAARGARRFRHRPVLRRADADDGDLSDLVRPGQSRGRGADRAGPDRHRRPPDPDRAPFARPRPLPHRLEPAPPGRSRRACVLAGGRPRSRPARCPSSWASSCRRSIWRSSRWRSGAVAVDRHFLRDAANSLGLAAAAAVDHRRRSPCS